MSEPRSSALDPTDLEILAAFIDGQLGGAERDAVVARLAEDEDYYEVYAETLEFLEAESPTPSSESHIETTDAAIAREVAARDRGPVDVTPEKPAEDRDDDTAVVVFPMDPQPKPERATWQRPWWPIVGSLAALLVLAFSLWRLWPRDLGLAEGLIAGLDPSINATFNQAQTPFGWSVSRGPINIAPWVSDDGLAWRAGVRRMRLGLLLKQGFRQAAATEARRIDNLFEALEHVGFPLYLADVIGQDDDAQLQEILAMNDELFSQVSDAYQLGLFTQACVVAAEHGDRGFFEKPHSRATTATLLEYAALRERVDERTRPDIDRALAVVRRAADGDSLADVASACRLIAKVGGDLRRP